MSSLTRGLMAFIVLLAFITAPILHNAIPHTHGGSASAPVADGVYPDAAQHNHNKSDSEESPIWASLHSAVRHEEKKSFSAAVINTTDIVIIISVLVLFQTLFFISRALPLFDPYRGRYLNRGIALYRRFR